MDRVQLDKRRKTIAKAGKFAIAAWPVGLLLGWLMSIDQDAAGAGMAYGIGLFMTLLFVAFPACVVMLWSARGICSELSGKDRTLVFVSLTPFVLLVGAAVWPGA